MELPNLSRIVETYVPVSAVDLSSYLSQLRQDVLAHIRALQSDGHLRWFSFLVHPLSQLAGRDPADESPVIHLRLEPTIGLDVREFIKLLPRHFQDPRQFELSAIGGIEGSLLLEDNWTYAWRLIGECSEWVLCLLEAHKGEPPPNQILQFLHYITNQLGIGKQCLYLPTGIQF